MVCWGGCKRAPALPEYSKPGENRRGRRCGSGLRWPSESVPGAAAWSPETMHPTRSASASGGQAADRPKIKTHALVMGHEGPNHGGRLPAWHARRCVVDGFVESVS